MSSSHGGEVPSKYHAKKSSDAANLVNLEPYIEFRANLVRIMLL
jgi:hypothetical protein